VVDYGILIGQEVIETFPLGIVNSHFSLLPQWRGADPITFAILSGQKQTGVSLMLIVPKLDEGPLLAVARYDIPAGITTPQLTDELISLSNKTLKAVLPQYIEAKVQPLAQDLSQPVTYSRKLSKADGQVDWTKPAEQLEREVRAYLGWPGSYTNMLGRDVIITAAHTTDEDGTAGTVADSRKELKVYTAKGALVIDKLKPAGKAEMGGAAFLSGLR
jgi:methionyl-tRNA formyltransferase